MIEITATTTAAPVVTVNVRPLASKPAQCGEETSAGLAGINISITGFTAPGQYQVTGSFIEDPGKNGLLWFEKSLDGLTFTAKHHGTTAAKFAWIVVPTGV